MRKQAEAALRQSIEEKTRALEDLAAAQDRLVRTERLRALGEMAAGVAHDFNNLLAVVLGRTELLLARFGSWDPAIARGLEAVRRAGLDGKQTVRRILEFTRTRQTRPPGRVDLGEVLREVLELNRPRWKDEAQARGVRYDVAVVVGGDPLPLVAGRPEELREVFTNLLVNALEAMPDGGRFTFRVTPDPPGATVRAEDTGCGMSEATRQRLFEPFFTTKGARGTGLGLAVSWGIVTRYGGTIEVESLPGAGSTFVVRLPPGPVLAGSETPAAPALATPAHRAARILIVDDEVEVRAVLRDILAGQGYAVAEADDGAEALARCAEGLFDLLVTDISMPGMSGWEVAAACCDRFPWMTVGLATGWGDQLDPEQVQTARVAFVLAKPFEGDVVLREVARVVEHHAPWGTAERGEPGGQAR
jgi:CheY-like chemotaxis protein